MYTVFSVRSDPYEGIDTRHQNNSCDNIFFKIVFASIISELKICKIGAIETKAKDVVGNENKVILCNKCFGNYTK